MTSKPYLYDHKANVLRQRAEYCPVWNKFDIWSEYIVAMAEYRQYVNSLPAYTPVSGWVPEVGKEYVEGVDFDILYDITEWDSDHANRSEFKRSNMFVKEHCVFDFMRDSPNEKDWHCVINESVAVPIEQKQEEPNLEEQAYNAALKVGILKGLPLCCYVDGYLDGAKANQSFTLADMIECWEAAERYGYDKATSYATIGAAKVYPNKEQYFKTKFELDLP